MPTPYDEEFIRIYIKMLKKSMLDYFTQCDKALTELETRAGFNPGQPRVPAGNSDGGEWTDGGGGSGDERISNPSSKPESRTTTSKPVQKPVRKPSIRVGPKLRQPPDYQTARRASAAYGETAGLLPRLKNPASSPYDPKNWDEESAKNLAKARAYIGIVSERNPRVNFALPSDTANQIEARAWSDSVDAAILGNSQDKLDKRVTNFFLRQEGVGRQRPEKWPKTLKILVTVGPFNNAGGGDVPRGSKTYIDFYGQEE